MRFIATLVISLLASAAPALAQETQPATVSLDELEKMALEANPTLRAAEARAESARQLARQAGAWPNPVVGFSAEEIRLEDVDPRGEYGLFVEQTILLGGKLRLNRAVFERTAEQSDAELELQRQRVTSGVRRAFYAALTADQRVDVFERLSTLVSEAVAITAQLFNVGAADRPDYLESEIETRRVQLALNEARNEAFASKQQLAAAVGAPDIAGRTLRGSLDDALPELSREEVLQRFLDHSPQLRAARAAAARAQAETGVARRETFPDLFVRAGASYNREVGDETGRPIGWEGALEAGVSVPLFNRNRYGIAAARAEEARATAELRRMELLLRSEVAMSFARYLTAIRNMESYRDEMIPKAEEAYRLYLARYREMAAAYPQVLIAQRTLLELSADYLEQVDRAWQTAMDIQGFLAGDGLDSPGQAIESRQRGGAQ